MRYEFYSETSLQVADFLPTMCESGQITREISRVEGVQDGMKYNRCFHAVIMKKMSVERRLSTVF
jgi:hypothetical protein